MTYRTILLKGSELNEIQDDMRAGEASIYPGCLLYVSATDTVSLHATANGPAAALFAKENDLMGSEVGTAYTNGERVQFLRCRKGDVIAARISTNNSIAVGDWLASDGAGNLQEWTATSSAQEEYPNSVLARALEACTTTSATALCKVLIV